MDYIIWKSIINLKMNSTKFRILQDIFLNSKIYEVGRRRYGVQEETIRGQVQLKVHYIYIDGW